MFFAKTVKHLQIHKQMHCTLIKDQIRQKFNSDTIFVIYKEEEYIERYETDDDTYKQKVDSHTIQSKVGKKKRIFH